MGAKRKQTHSASDQYGEFKSQDREEHAQFSKGSQTGGGTAGSSRRGPEVKFERHVPKFLQPFAHMLGKSKQQQEEEEEMPVAVEAEGSDDDPEDQLHADAMRRALEEQPELKGELGERWANKVEAEAAKQAGNEAYAAKKWAQAVQHFTRAIHLDPENEIYYSNRSAAHASAGEWQAALEDAEKLVTLKPRWVKSWARLGAARYGLRQYSDAVEAYRRALKLEPDDHTLQKGLEKAQMEELRQVKDNKHVFKRRKPSGAGGKGGGGGSGGGDKGKAVGGAGKGLLSFNEEEDEEG